MHEYNSIIDYTLLDVNASKEGLISLCAKAIKLGVASVCVYPKHVLIVSELLKGTNVLTCSVISFPNGNNTIEEKIIETEEAIRNGVDEIDLVLNYHLIADLNYLKSELVAIKKCCSKTQNKIGQFITLKVIVESGLLSLEETAILTQLCIDTKVDFIKTSTGKVAVGAELSKVQIMYDTIVSANSNLKIKASGGIRTLEDVTIFLPYVSRLGMGYQTVDVLNGI